MTQQDLGTQPVGPAWAGPGGGRPEDDERVGVFEHVAATHEAALRLDQLVVEHAESLWQEPSAARSAIEDQKESEAEQLLQARTGVARRLERRSIQAQPGSPTYGSPTPRLSDWLREAQRLSDLADRTRVPLFTAARQADKQRFVALGQQLMAHYTPVRQDIGLRRDQRLRELYAGSADEWRARIRSATAAHVRTLGPGIRDARPVFPTRVLPPWMGGGSTSAGRAPRPVVSPGAVHLDRIRLQTDVAAPDSTSAVVSREVALTTTDLGLSFPVFLDLDGVGGFLTDSPDAAMNTVLQLLSVVPPGRLRIDGVDPIGLGESLSYLYGLNDAGDQVLGDAIWTTSDQTARLLVELEQHITFVTQKYLQGQHKTLTDYNVAAGEVAEPYRLVLLYDFPKMFTRDGRTWDDESLVRLRKLAAAGRRCGVFIVAVTDTGAPHQVWLDQLVPLFSQQTFGAPTRGATSRRVTHSHLDWSFRAHPPAPDEVRDSIHAGVLRGLEEGTTTQVDPSTVAEIATRRSALSAARGLRREHVIADPAAPATWWTGSSQESVVARFGRLGASDVANLTLNSDMESSALIGGRTGSGKSYLLHSVILSLVTQYSPAELDLYLIDLKEGVEFKQYADAGLPHAAAVAVESNREFAVSVLQALDSEIAARGKAFKHSGEATVNLALHRQRSGEVWPRVVLVIDEFHKLFEQDDALKRRAEALLERVIKEGRAFGVHVLLASQSIASVGASFRSLAGQIYYRLVLASSEADSRVLLSEDNTDAQLLTRAGEGILNAKAGIREANNRFQTTYWATDRRGKVLEELRARADAEGFTRHPRVFEGNAEFSAAEVPVDQLGRSSSTGALQVPVGAPMSLDPVVTALVERAPGSNMLVVDPEGVGTVVLLAADFLRAGIEVTLVDFAAFGAAWEPAKEVLRDAGAIERSHRELRGTLDDLLAELDRRQGANNYVGPGRVLVLGGIHRARDLVPNSYDEEAVEARLLRLLVNGPEHGLFTLVWADRAASVERRLSRDALRELGIKLVGQMSAEDSRTLVDSEVAANVNPSQYVFDDFDRALTAVVRRLQYPGHPWLAAQLGATRATR